MSVTVSTIAPLNPVTALYAGPTTNHALPVQIFSCSFVVSYHRSPWMLFIGADALAVVDDTTLNADPL